MRQAAARRRPDPLVVTVGRERSDDARKPKAGQHAIWTLVDTPSPAAERSISRAVNLLETWLRDLPDVKIDRNGSESIIMDVGLRQAAVSPIAYDSNTRAIEINERCRFWDDPKKSMKGQ